MKILKYMSSMLLILLAANIGCTKWVDELKPETSQSIESLSTSSRDLETLVNGAYTGVFAPAGMGVFVELAELNSDFYTIYETRRAQAVATGGSYQFYSHSYSTNTSPYARYCMQWNNLTIQPATYVIQTIEAGTAASDPSILTNGDRLLGECYALRGLAYWQLTMLFGPQYHSSTIDAPSAVWRKEAILGPEDIPAPRATVGQMYDHVIADLKKAIQYLPESYDPTIHPVGFKARIRKDFAVATLAKVYFQMNKFDSALVYVNKLLGPVSSTGSSKYPLAANIQTLFTKVSASPFIDWGWKSTDAARIPEVIFAIDGVSAFRMTRQDKWGFMQMTVPIGTPGITGAKELFKLGLPYLRLMGKGDTTRDRRFTQLVIKKPFGRWQNKMSTSAMYYPLLRAAEFHLMRAEILARNNNLTDALTELNLVRLRANLLAFNSASQTAVIQEVIDERGREMLGEANRFFDMLRISALSDGTVKVPLGQRHPDDKSFVGGVDELPFDSPYLFNLIPANEYQYNPGL